MSSEESDVVARRDDLAVALYSLAASVVRRMPRDLSLTAAATLHALERHGPLRVTRLAALEGVTQPSMTSLVTKLVRAGLVERRPDPSDGRGVLVALTDTGEGYVHERRHVGAARLIGLLDDLPVTQVRALWDALPALLAVAALDDRDTGAASRLSPTAEDGLQ